MTRKSKYGYKVCYRKYGKSQIKIFCVTNSYDLAMWHVCWYEREPQLKKPAWFIREIKTLKEYEKLWKGCPFKDDLS